MNNKKSEKSFFKKFYDIVGWLCMLITAWLLYMAYHDEVEEFFNEIIGLIPDGNLWVGLVCLVGLVGIGVMFFKLLARGFNLKFGNQNRSINDWGLWLLDIKEYGHLKYFFISSALLIFIIYVVIQFFNDMVGVDIWRLFLSLDIGGQMFIGLLILGVDIWLTVSTVKKIKEQLTNKMEDIKEI